MDKHKQLESDLVNDINLIIDFYANEKIERVTTDMLRQDDDFILDMVTLINRGIKLVRAQAEYDKQKEGLE